jgi:hypothetical protein
MFFIRHKARKEKSMKRIKRLLVMLCVIVLGVIAVPAKAEVEPCPYNNGVHYATRIRIEPTCMEEGRKTFRCGNCGRIIMGDDDEIIPKLPHRKSEWIISKTPTLSSNGEKIIKCLLCNTILQKQTIPKLPSTSQLNFTKKSLIIKKGKTVKLKYTRRPIKAKDKLLWKSSKSRIVKILKNGKIKGIKKGKSIVTLYTNTGKKAKISITVK